MYTYTTTKAGGDYHYFTFVKIIVVNTFQLVLHNTTASLQLLTALEKRPFQKKTIEKTLKIVVNQPRRW